MTHVDKDTKTIYIAEEPPGKCELCGKITETRPYGPNREEICFDCGSKNPEAAWKAFVERVGVPLKPYVPGLFEQVKKGLSNDDG